MKHAQVMTLVQWARGATWRIGLQHSCPKHAVVWITRGQGLAVIGGVRRGLGVTQADLTRVCNTLSGRTPAELRTERSLHAARETLEDTDLPVTRIASGLGFGSAAYFLRFILHHTGQSPSALRNKAATRGSVARAL